MSPTLRTPSRRRTEERYVVDAPRPTTLLELLDDEYALDILEALDGGAKPARELVEACDGSRPTVYRRLDRLETAGLVDSETAVHPDGHHRKEFTTDVERVTLELTDGEFTVSVKRTTSRSAPRDADGRTPR